MFRQGLDEAEDRCFWVWASACLRAEHAHTGVADKFDLLQDTQFEDATTIQTLLRPSFANAMQVYHTYHISDTLLCG